MIALKMASILESYGETVLQVLMIDFASPEGYPPLLSKAEHAAVAYMTYHAAIGRMHGPSSDLFDDSEETGKSGIKFQSDVEEEFDLLSVLAHMRNHISNALPMVADASDSPFFVSSTPLQATVTLIKRSKLTPPSNTLREARQEYV